jgi:hypothetical protein
MLEFFRAKHGHEKVNEEGEGDEADEGVFHGGRGLESFAEPDVETAEGKKCGERSDVDEIVHAGGATVAADMVTSPGPDCE